MYLSKSKFCRGVQCPKMLWMDWYKPEEAEDIMNEAVLETGNQVGDLAMGYFGEFIEVPFSTPVSKMIDITKQYLVKGYQNICEASFSYNGNFCSVDILRMFEDCVDIVEVKSSTSVNDIYVYDMAYQYYVLTHCGLNVRNVYNLHINSSYVRHGDLDLLQLFTLENYTEKCLMLQDEIHDLFPMFEEYYNLKNEPKNPLGLHCFKPYPCVYWKYCSRHLPIPNVFDIANIATKTKVKLYKDGIYSFQDALSPSAKLKEKQIRQIETELNNLPPTVNTTGIRKFLNGLTYPLYYLDFETFQQAIPQYDDVSPYAQIPFQYSLHYQLEPQGELHHLEFLGKEGTDPRRALAEQLVHDIPMNVCTLAYNMGFEKGVIKKLAGIYPDLSEHLMNIHDHIQDLMIPFRNQDYYCKEMEGSYSIKKVLPAVCPNDSELNYHNLDQIHNGSEAMTAFAQLPNHSPEEIQTIRTNLLKYCCLDTLAMVKILEKLYEAIKE